MADSNVKLNVNVDLKPINKLLTMLSSWFGPGLLRRNAEAEAAAKIAEARAEAQVKLIGARATIDEKKLLLQGEHDVRTLEAALKAQEAGLAEADIITVVWEEPAELTAGGQRPFEFVEQKRLNNIKRTTAEALKALPMPAEVSDEPVDPDWTARFFDAAKDVSHEEMQQLWGRLLAGEVAQPGTYSLRVLDTLRNLSTSEARLFTAYSQRCTDQGLLIAPPRYGLDRGDVSILTECGLLTEYRMIDIAPNRRTLLVYGPTRLVVDLVREEPRFGRAYGVALDGWKLTSVGRAIAALSRRVPDLTYVRALREALHGYYGLSVQFESGDGGVDDSQASVEPDVGDTPSE